MPVSRWCERHDSNVRLLRFKQALSQLSYFRGIGAGGLSRTGMPAQSQSPKATGLQPAYLADDSACELVPDRGLEPLTTWLQSRCSTYLS